MRTLSNTLFLLTPSFLAMAWLVSRAKWFWNNQPDLQFGWVVLVLCIYLFHESWAARPPVNVRLRWWVVLTILSGCALLVFIQGYWAIFGMHPAIMQGFAAGLLLLACANLGLVFGWAGVRQLGFAYAFILIALPLPTIIYGPLVAGLQSKVATVNVELLNLIGIPAQQVGSLIHLPNGTVGIDEACSGVRSLQSTIMAAIFIGYVALKRNSLRLVLFGAGVVLAIVGNIGRSLYLSLMAHWRGMDAIDKVHDAAGWSVLAFTAAGVVLLSWMISRAERAVQTAAAAQGRLDDD